MSDEPRDSDTPALRPELAELRERTRATRDEGRAEAVEKQHARGGRTARENIDALVDPGSFVEYGALALAAQRLRHSVDELIRRSPADGIVCGLASVNGDRFGPDRARTMVLVYDYTVMAGTQGIIGHQKLDRMLAIAAERRTPIADQSTLRDALPENRRRAYKIRPIVETLADTGSVLEIRRDFGCSVVTALARFEGQPAGVLANDTYYLGGAVDAEAADKAARFLQLCDAFGLPVVSLVDTPGFMVGPKAETTALVRRVSRMFIAGATLSVPVFTVVLRKGYGLGAQAMAGGHFKAPVFTISWPTGEFGGMNLEGAVRLGMKRELEAIEDEAAREQAVQAMTEIAHERGKAINVASLFELDAVIDPAETRHWLVRGLRSVPPAERGARRVVDAW